MIALKESAPPNEYCPLIGCRVVSIIISSLVLFLWRYDGGHHLFLTSIILFLFNVAPRLLPSFLPSFLFFFFFSFLCGPIVIVTEAQDGGVGFFAGTCVAMWVEYRSPPCRRCFVLPTSMIVVGVPCASRAPMHVVAYSLWMCLVVCVVSLLLVYCECQSASSPFGVLVLLYAGASIRRDSSHRRKANTLQDYRSFLAFDWRTCFIWWWYRFSIPNCSCP